MNQEWELAKKRICSGWHTWNNDSVLSYIRPLDGVGLRLCVKDYKNAAFLENVLIGETEATVIPKAHAYDDSYIELYVKWLDNEFEVISAVSDEGDLVVLVRTLDKRVKPSTLCVQGLSLYNKGKVIRKRFSASLVLDTIPVYITEETYDELYVPIHTPYMAVSMVDEVGISTGVVRSVEHIKAIIKEKKDAYLSHCSAAGVTSSDETAFGMGKADVKIEGYRAMQTCQAWDTIYDPVLKSPITTVSRIWNKQWGGYVLFCWDTFFGAMMQSVDNKELAYCNVFAILDAITEEGFVPNYACQNGFKSFDRSQPPVGSMACLEIYKRHREAWFLAEVFPKLCAWNNWFAENRMTPNGMLSWGSNPYEIYYDHGLEHDGIDDWQGASYESGLDNSPMYEDIPYDKERHIFMLDDVGLTGLYIQDCYALMEIAEELGLTMQREQLAERAAQMEKRMEALWDEETGLYLNRRTDTGAFEHRLSPFHFHALFSKRVTPEKIVRILKDHLLNEQEFWTNYPLPSIAKSDPSYVKQTYWQGRVWAPMNFLVYKALKSAEENMRNINYENQEVIQLLHDTRNKLAEKSMELILKEWREKGHVHENYDPENGEGCNNERSDSFYHWGGLLAYMSFDET